MQQAVKLPELSDDERVALIAGAWESVQADELESYGEPLIRAIIALEHGRIRILDSSFLSDIAASCE